MKRLGDKLPRSSLNFFYILGVNLLHHPTWSFSPLNLADQSGISSARDDLKVLSV
jgi:hypothetical protein